MSEQALANSSPRDLAESSLRQEFLLFQLGGKTYALAIGKVEEILLIPPITPVPRAPETILGIVGVRGRVLTVLDIRSRLGIDRIASGRGSRILVVPWTESESVGLYVDRVLQVSRLTPSEIESPSTVLGSDAGEHVIGLARVAGELVVVVHLTEFLRV